MYARRLKSHISTLFSWRWSRRLSLRTTVILFAFFPIAAMAALPPVLLVDDHSDVLVPWIKTGIRGAVVVNVDAHDDCVPITQQHINKLRHFLEVGDMAAIGRANTVADSGLYDISNFISAAYALGIAREAVWAAPLFDAPGLVYDHLPFRTCSMDSLSALRIKEPVLLTVDADCVNSFANYRCINLVEAVRRIAEALRGMPWNVVHASVSFSTDGRYLPVTLRWIGNALQEAIEGKNLSRPNAPWSMLAKVEDWRRSLPPREIVRLVRPLVQKQPKNPWFRVYLSDALFRADSLSSALAEGKKAALLDQGCCRILLELGDQLAIAGRLDEAELFLAAAPTLVSASAEFALAQGLDQAGHTAKAIEHYSRIYKQVANYSTDLLIGYGYERLGDTAKAKQYYLHAVALLANPVSEMAGFANLTLSVAAAEHFLRSNGYEEQAQALRKDHRLLFYFENKDTSGTAGRR
jgi:tetratricopeptide (TPR) repeat protein